MRKRGRFVEELEGKVPCVPSLLNLSRDWNIPRDIRKKIIGHLGPFDLAMVLIAHFSFSSCVIKHETLDNIKCYAAFRGYIGILESDDRLRATTMYDLPKIAAIGGQVRMLEWLKNNNHRIDIQQVMLSAAFMGHVKVLDWVWWWFGEGECIHYVESVSEAASKKGHVPVLVWCHKREKRVDEVCYAHAIKRNQINVVKWLVQHQPDIHPTRLLFAARCGQVEIMDVLMDMPGSRMQTERLWDEVINDPIHYCKIAAWMRRRGMVVDERDIRNTPVPILIPKQYLDTFPPETQTEYREALIHYFEDNLCFFRPASQGEMDRFLAPTNMQIELAQEEKHDARNYDFDDTLTANRILTAVLNAIFPTPRDLNDAVIKKLNCD